MTKPLVIYHGNCADGFTAAWLYNMWYAQQQPLAEGQMPRDWVVDHHAGVYGKPPPDVFEREVVILDFSYPPEVMKVICDEAAHVTIIDHHISAIKALQDFEHPRFECHFDDSRCGSYLTAKYLWPDREPSRMVELVDDRDRWVFQYPQTRDFHASLFSRPYAIGEWNKLNASIPEAILEGRAIERKHHKDIDELIKVCVQMKTVGIYENVPCVNLPYTMASDACHKLLEQYPDARFAAAWYLRADDKIVFSLRSRPNGFDVSELAKVFGGGGHVTAAGFSADVWPDAT